MFKEITSLEQLTSAYYKARRGKKTKRKICEFDFNLESNLIKIKHLLETEKYLPSLYTHFIIFEPKTRQVSAPAFPDRVVQHSLVLSIEPIFEKKFIIDSYACRENKGAHFGAKRVKNFLMAARCKYGKEQQIYVFQGDIKKYFQSIDWDILFSIIKKTIDCPKTLNLIKKILETHHYVKEETEKSLLPISVTERKGLPIGNLTSQLFANIYLNELDHYVKEILHEKWYSRYMDDFLIISKDKDHLKELQKQIELFLKDKLELSLHPQKLMIKNVSEGVPFVGYRLFYDHILIRGKTLIHLQRRYQQRLKLYKIGKIVKKDLLATKASIRGHLKHANAYNLSKFLD